MTRAKSKLQAKRAKLSASKKCVEEAAKSLASAEKAFAVKLDDLNSIMTVSHTYLLTPPQNWSKYNKSLFKEDMVYMNLENNWSLATPLTGLGCACSYYEIFSAKFMNFLNKKITGQSVLKNDHLCHLHF